MPHKIDATLDELFCRECNGYIHPDSEKHDPPMCGVCWMAARRECLQVFGNKQRGTTSSDRFRHGRLPHEKGMG
jgi:hypothetical protein